MRYKCSFGPRWQVKELQHMGRHFHVPQTVQWHVILLGSCHIWSDSSSRENLFLHNEGCHFAFTAYYWAGSYWQVSKHSVRKRRRCCFTSTGGYISTAIWTERIKHTVYGVAERGSFTPFYQWRMVGCVLRKTKHNDWVIADSSGVVIHY